MIKTNNTPAIKSPFFGLLMAIVMTAIGMLSVYLAGNARGYDPSLLVLVRNIFLMCLFLLVYALLRPTYKGSYAILVVVAFLTGLGFIVQYRVSAAINVNFQQTLINQYSAAALKKMHTDSSTVISTSTDSLAGRLSQERSLKAIQKEAEELLKIEELKPKQFMQEFFDNIPSWSRVILSYLIAFLLIVYLVKKCSDDRFMDTLAKPFFWISLTVVLLIVFVALSEVKTRGRFVYQMTPWEAFKITIIIFLSGFFAKYKEDFIRKKPQIKGQRLKSLLIPWGPFLLIWLIPQFLFVLLKDFGQVIIYSGLLVVMIFVLTKKYIYLFGGIAVSVVFSKLILLSAGFLPAHVLQRFQIWSNIWVLPHNETWWNNVYQIMNSFFALHAGGVTGAGLGLGYPTNIPLVVSDFVYAAIGEELGFLGAIVIVLAYLTLFFLGIRIVIEAANDFEKLLAVGFTTILAIQVLVNIGGVIKLIPLTGITLPFISRGGFSFLITFIIIGFLMGLSHRNGQRLSE